MASHTSCRNIAAVAVVVVVAAVAVVVVVAAVGVAVAAVGGAAAVGVVVDAHDTEREVSPEG